MHKTPCHVDAIDNNPTAAEGPQRAVLSSSNCFGDPLINLVVVL